MQKILPRPHSHAQTCLLQVVGENISDSPHARGGRWPLEKVHGRVLVERLRDHTCEHVSRKVHDTLGGSGYARTPVASLCQQMPSGKEFGSREGSKSGKRHLNADTAAGYHLSQQNSGRGTLADNGKDDRKLSVTNCLFIRLSVCRPACLSCVCGVMSYNGCAPVLPQAMFECPNVTHCTL